MDFFANGLGLQETLKAGSAVAGDIPMYPHHPITCNSRLSYDGEGRLACEHARCEPDNRRTLFAVQQSIAILLIEELVRLETGAPSGLSGPG